MAASQGPYRGDRFFYDLFATIETHVCLWKLDSPDYKNVHLKSTIWHKIAQELQGKHGGTVTADKYLSFGRIRAASCSYLLTALPSC